MKKTPSSGKSLISTYLRLFGWEPGRDQKGGWRLFEFEFEGGRWGGGGRLFEAGCLLYFSTFRMGANSRLGAYSNKYGTQNPSSSKYCTGWGRDGVIKKVSYRDALPHVQSLTLLCTIFDRKGNLFYEELPHISHYRE